MGINDENVWKIKMMSGKSQGNVREKILPRSAVTLNRALYVFDYCFKYMNGHTARPSAYSANGMMGMFVFAVQFSIENNP